MSFLIAAINARGASPMSSEYPVLSISRSVDDGYARECVSYWPHYLHQFNDGGIEYPGRPKNPLDFKIGVCSFVKLNGVWYLRPDETDPNHLHKIVYGQVALESYGSGEMFNPNRLVRTFGVN